MPSPVDRLPLILFPCTSTLAVWLFMEEVRRRLNPLWFLSEYGLSSVDCHLWIVGAGVQADCSPLLIRDTPLIPETSYGVCKNVIEMVTYDHARKGESDFHLPTKFLIMHPDLADIAASPHAPTNRLPRRPIRPTPHRLRPNRYPLLSRLIIHLLPHPRTTPRDPYNVSDRVFRPRFHVG